MPEALIWTPERDALLLSRRAQGHSWDAIAAEFAISRSALIARGRRLGLKPTRGPAAPPARPTPAPAPEDDPARPPLPPGHPRSWGLITQGTVLEGTPYPYPVFL